MDQTDYDIFDSLKKSFPESAYIQNLVYNIYLTLRKTGLTINDSYNKALTSFDTLMED